MTAGAPPAPAAPPPPRRACLPPARCCPPAPPSWPPRPSPRRGPGLALAPGGSRSRSRHSRWRRTPSCRWVGGWEGGREGRTACTCMYMPAWAACVMRHAMHAACHVPCRIPRAQASFVHRRASPSQLAARVQRRTGGRVAGALPEPVTCICHVCYLCTDMLARPAAQGGGGGGMVMAHLPRLPSCARRRWGRFDFDWRCNRYR